MDLVHENLSIRNMESNKVWDYENAFYWFSHPSRLAKMLAHYDLYKMIVDLPGDILEFGVYKGTSLVRLATFREILETNFSRKIIGFDAFGKFPRESLTLQSDLNLISLFEESGGDGLSDMEVKSVFDLKNISNVDLVKGNVFETLPKYLEENPALRISVLHLDMDVKEPTDFVLKELYSRIVPGGLIILDDYCAVEGESLAIDQFLREHKLKLRKLSHNRTPSYIQC